MKNKWLWLTVAVIAVIGVAVLLVLLPGNTPELPPATEPTEATDTTETTVSGETDTTIPSGETESITGNETAAVEQTAPGLPEELPPVVELPVETDPVTGERKGITFPANVEGYDLVIEKLAAYDGLFVEDGSNVQVEGVAMLLLKNNGDFPVEYTEITVEYETVTLVFSVSALPVGERLVVQEKSGQAMPEGKPLSCRAMVVQRAELSMSEGVIKVTENGDDSITVTNLTKEMIPTVRVFYKYYMADQNIYVGGIAFTVRLTRLGAESSVTVRPAHYSSASGKVVMALTYSEEA